MAGTILNSLSPLLRRWQRMLGARERVATCGELADYLAGRAAFVSQKSTIEYCRARAGLFWDKLFREHEFGRAMEYCRWEAYVAVLGDVAETCQVLLRARGLDHPALADALAPPVTDALLRHPVPAHRTSWNDAAEEILARLARAMLAAPRAVHLIGRTSAARVFEVLPIHTSLRAHDRELVENSIRFLLCRIYADMEADLDVARLARSLALADPSEARRPAALLGEQP